jgi:hypothetical protein
VIEDTIVRLNEARATLVREPPNDFRVMAGFEMARNTAKRDVETLTKQLSREAMEIGVPVFVTGGKALEFSKAMADITPSAVVDLKDIYQLVYDAVAQSLGRDKTFGVSQFMIVVTTLRQLAVDNGLAAIEMPKFEEPEVVNTPEDLRRVVLKYADKAVGSELSAEYVRKQVALQAAEVLDRGVPVFPVFLVNAKEHQNRLAQTFKRPAEVSLTAPEEVTEETAIEALKTIKKTVKKSKE